MVVRPYSTVVTTFLWKTQFSGLYGSSGPSKSTIAFGDDLMEDNGCVNRVGWRLRILDITRSSLDTPEESVALSMRVGSTLSCDKGVEFCIV
jgi:hypothetical protein